MILRAYSSIIKLTKHHQQGREDVEGDKAWIVTGEFELFGEIREFFYVISDQTGEVAYTFDELGNRDPHIERLMRKEWEDYVDEDD